MSNLAIRAEITKLAATLGTTEERLSYLATFDASTLRTFREQASDMLFEADRKRMEGIASATKLVPVAISAKVAEKTFPARLAAAVAGLLEPGKAVELARRLPVPFLAELTPHLDPRRVSDILSRIPTDIVLGVGQILAEQGEHITMGRFVGHLDADVLTSTLAVVDDEALLRIGFVIEDPSQLPAIVRLLPAERLGGVVRAAQQHALWPEALNLLDLMDEDVRRQLADAAAGEDDEVLEGMIAVADEQSLWDIALPVVGAMSPASRARFAALPGLRAPGLVDRIFDVAEAEDLVRDLLPLVDELPDDLRAVIQPRLDALV